MEQTEFLRSLRAVRRYSAEPIPDEVLHDLLETARWTGSSKNTQPWELIVVEDRATLEQLAGLGQFAGHLAGARLALVLVMDSPSAGGLDAGRLAQTIMLAAWCHGIGSCIGSLFPAENEAQAKELLGVPAERSMRTAIALGYPADEQSRLLSKANDRLRSTVPLGRKPLAEMVHWERFGGQRPRAT